MSLFKKRSPERKATFFFHIDKFECEDGRVSVSGWAFFAEEEVRGAAVLFRRSGQNADETKSGQDSGIFTVDAVYGNPREDLAAHFGSEHFDLALAERAGRAGFFAEIVAENAEGFEAVLRVMGKTRQEEIALGVVTEDRPKERSPGATPAIPAFYALRDVDAPTDLWPGRREIPAFAGRTGCAGRTGGNLPPVDIIIPVYNGLEYLDTFFASVRRTEAPYRLILIDDASPDPRVWPYLEEAARVFANAAITNSKFLLLRNETNLGFVKTVNEGLRLTEGHTVILNTDVELPEGWLERLLAPILLDDLVASVTPFSNSAEIYSFPVSAIDNEIPSWLTVAEVDDVFRRVRPGYTEIPTGVGFCMALGKKALSAVGLFEEETFAEGYGEENDWCRRAASLGYRNVLAENLFVWHKHGGSFLPEEKQRLMARNAAKLSEKHPDYDEAIARFMRRDPLRPFRNDVLFELLRTREDAETILVFTHDWGGGASLYLDERTGEWLAEGRRVLTVRTDSSRHVFEAELRLRELNAAFLLRTPEALIRHTTEDIGGVLDGVRIDEIFVNSIASFTDIPAALVLIQKIKAEKKARLVLPLHDYLCVCPTIHVVKKDSLYCGLVTDPAVCDACLTDNPYNLSGTKDMAAWRTAWGTLLKACDEVRCFSPSSEEILKKVYPSLTNLTLKPHRPCPLPALGDRPKTTDTINIGLIGKLSDIKGRRIVEKMLSAAGNVALQEAKNAQEATERNGLRRVRLILLGYAEPPIDAADESEIVRFRETGSYAREDLPKLIAKYDIDIVFIASTGPETFSYTTAEAISMGLPVAGFDFGGQADQIRQIENGLLLPIAFVHDADADTERNARLFAFANSQAASRHRK
ncbi:glycosyl transferase [Clostridia bacterium]|nr:glycosyl transferase [Clostridia bacterium]